MSPERYEQIGRLYQAALECEPAGRAAFLAEACGADDELRREVESLIAASEQADDFIAQPPDDVAAGWQVASALPWSSFGHYRMLSLLGRGGMGEVWLAEDTQLSRKVAVKLLPAEFTTQPERVRRFAQEARAASALNHPNIITIHEIGKTDSTHYIVTEHVEGETLRQRMNAAPDKRLKLSDAIEIAAQIAAALAAAHEAGIVHRDIKPENVMVRRDGLVKVLDFGLAKLTDRAGAMAAEETATADSSTAGLVIGTPRYMSPEQARGEKVDHRSDLFSLGVLLYEMLAGRAPFAGKTASDTIAAILRDEPPPLAAETPHELARIVGKTLQKDRAERYQTADALLADLKQLQRELEFAALRNGERERAGAASKSLLRQPQLAHAPRSVAWRRAVLAAVIVSLATLTAWFYFKRPPALTEKDTILLADFENKTDEEVFDGVLKQGLAIQLQQSPVLNLFPEESVQQTLRLMQRPPEERLTAATAREICQRENIKALVAGTLAKLGSRYVLALEATNGQSGATLARTLTEAEGQEQVLRALSQAATELRAKLGESLGSIQQFNRPLEDATTANLEAFKFHAQAVVLALNGKTAEAIPVEQRAIELDRNFAFAYSLLAMLQRSINQMTPAAECAAHAYALRERVSEFERLRIIFRYHLLVTGEMNQAVEALRLQKQMYPRIFSASNDLALAYNTLGLSEEAAAEAEESIRLHPNFFASRFFLALARQRQNRFADARAALTQALALKLDHPWYRTSLYELAFINNDQPEMQQQIEWARGRPVEHLAFAWQSGAAAFAGQWRKAQELLRHAIALTARGKTQEIAAQYLTEQALRGAALGDCRQAKTDALKGLALARSRGSLPRAALALALCGERRQAQPLLAELARFPEDTLINSLWLPTIRAALALQRGQAAQAIEQLQITSRYEAAAEFWPQYLRGQAYLQLKQSAEAAAEFQKILDHRGYAPLSVLYPLAHLSLARAAALTGDTAQSRKSYEAFLALWKDADPDLPVLTQTKREFEKK